MTHLLALPARDLPARQPTQAETPLPIVPGNLAPLMSLTASMVEVEIRRRLDAIPS